MSAKPNATDVEAGRFTLTVVGVDLAKNTVSVIGAAAARCTPTRPTPSPSRTC